MISDGCKYQLDWWPSEILRAVFMQLDCASRLTAGFVCRRWLNILSRDYTRVIDLRLVLEDGYCQTIVPYFEHTGSPSAGSYELVLTFCQCPHHAIFHCATLRGFLEVAGKNIVRVVIEDLLLKSDCFLTAGTLDTLLNLCCNLASFELHYVDLSKVPRGILAKIEKLINLDELAFHQCSQRKSGAGPILTDRLLIGINAGGRLKRLQVTHCHTITDRCLKQLAKNCPLLRQADFTGCSRITGKGVAYFCTTMAYREADMSYLKISKTTVIDQLQRYLFGPSAVKSGEKWMVTGLRHAALGKACCIQNLGLPDKSLIIFV